MPDRDANAKMDQLARDVLRLSRNTLLVNLRFLDAALSQFTLVPEEGTIATDGEHIFYDACYVLQRYREQKEQPVRDYLHMVLHCVFRHNFVGPLMEPTWWDLACDIAVENIINELGLSAATTKRQSTQQAALNKITAAVRGNTAEKIYHYLRQEVPSPVEVEILAQLFRADDHTCWYQWLMAAEAGGDDQSDNEGRQARGNTHHSELEQTWKNISERMQMDMETFSKQRGDQAGSLTQNLRAVNRERYDYTAFLKKFATMGEAMKINDDEFDYIFYTYGLEHYHNMPLIEPLEYKEVKRIKEFVIAIDTSGSTSGELVQKFVQKTYNILKQQENFFTKINLHIIQCDAEIQEDAKITGQEEFDRYLKTMQLKGFGGTDFRPVFGYVNWLLEKGEFTNLKGLIYFTDGYGVFPGKKPDYQTAFVFIDDEFSHPDVPVWAVKLVLQREEI